MSNFNNTRLTRRNVGSAVLTSAILVAGGLLVSSCRTTDSLATKPFRVKSARQAGAVLTSVTRAVPFEDVVDDIKAEFEMTPALALQKGLPLTQRERSQSIDSISSALKVQFPGMTFSDSTTTKTSAEGVTTTEKTESESLSSSDRDKLVPEHGINVADKLKAMEPLVGTVETNPRLEYRDAYSLYQTVKLLNRSLQDAPQWTNMRPYLVTMQISLLGFGRHMPYDAFSTISFFSGRKDGITIPAVKGEKSEKDSAGEKLDNPIVVPLLVSDALESSLQDRTANRVRQLSVTLSALIEAVGVGAKFDSLQQKLNAILAQDLNSLMTDGRLTANTVMIRMGAAHEGTSKYAIVPQKYEVTFLVLVPKELFSDVMGDEARYMRYLAKTSFRDAETGEILTETTADERVKAVKLLEQRQIVKKGYLLKRDRFSFDLVELFGAVHLNDYNGFVEKLAQDDASPYPEVLWLELADLYNYMAYSQSPFQLHAPKQVTYPPTNQFALLQADKKLWTVNLVGGKNLKTADLSAELLVPVNQKNSSLAASALAVSADRTSLSLKFPAVPAEIGIGKGFYNLVLKSGEIEKTYASVYKPEKEVNPAATARQLSLTSPLNAITVDKHGAGEVQLFIVDNEKSTEEQPYFVQIVGAAVETAPRQAQAIVAWDGELFRILKGGEVRLALSNLSAGENVIVNLYDKAWGEDKTKAKPIATKTIAIKALK